MRAEGECLSEETLLGLLERGLDSGIREDLRVHLDGCRDCRQLVAVALQELKGASKKPPPKRAAAPNAGPDYLPRGEKVGAFTIERVIGEGAMGVVYRARHRPSGELAALKLSRGSTDAKLEVSLEELQARLRREGRILAGLQHPNVVPVREVGMHQGEVFLAMELIEGESLDSWLERSAPNASRVIEVFLAIAAGIAAAHAVKVVHRDLKPGNVMIERKTHRPLVMDFGLATEARKVEPSAPLRAATFVTRTGMHVGTPAYMAPEQLDGARGSEASDQFSFAVMLYEALYGQRPFKGRTLKHYLDGVRAGELLAPPQEDPGAKFFPPLRRALSREPERRHPSVAQLAEALRRAG